MKSSSKCFTKARLPLCACQHFPSDFHVWHLNSYDLLLYFSPLQMCLALNRWKKKKIQSAVKLKKAQFSAEEMPKELLTREWVLSKGKGHSAVEIPYWQSHCSSARSLFWVSGNRWPFLVMSLVWLKFNWVEGSRKGKKKIKKTW